MKEKRNVEKPIYWIMLVVLLVLAISLTSRGGASQESDSTQPSTADDTEQPAKVEDAEPVILRVGGLDTIDCWNPHSCTSIWFYGHLIVEGFTDHGSASTGCSGVPRLADSWKVSEDGLIWTIYLHEGITFNDGTPVNAQTIVDYIN